MQCLKGLDDTQLQQTEKKYDCLCCRVILKANAIILNVSASVSTLPEPLPPSTRGKEGREERGEEKSLTASIVPQSHVSDCFLFQCIIFCIFFSLTNNIASVQQYLLSLGFV